MPQQTVNNDTLCISQQRQSILHGYRVWECEIPVSQEKIYLRKAPSLTCRLSRDEQALAPPGVQQRNNKYGLSVATL